MVRATAKKKGRTTRKTAPPAAAKVEGNPQVAKNETRLLGKKNDHQPATLTSSVYEQVRTDVLSGKLRPGEKLRAEALRTRFKTGSSPVREALNRLLSESFVALEDQKGFRVAPVSRQELSELVTARCWIDGAAISESIRRFDTVWEENLILALHRLSKTPRSQRGHSPHNAEWEDRHKAFHRALVSGCGSRWITRISDQLFDAAERYRLLAADHVSARNELDEHRTIVNACLERNADLAVDLLKAHYNRTFEIIIRSNFHGALELDEVPRSR